MWRCLEQCDVEGVRRLWHHVSPNMPQPQTDKDALVTIHMARTQMEAMRQQVEVAKNTAAQQYQALLDEKHGRVHAGITLAQEVDARGQKQVIDRLTKALGREVRAFFRADPRILGGVVVRVGDRIYDGSVKRRLNALQRRMLTGE